MQHVLFGQVRETVYRHSRLSYYYVYRTGEKLATPIGGRQTLLQYAEWNPNIQGSGNQYIAFVRQNNIWLQLIEAGQQHHAFPITSSGSSVIANGVPDWLYEEEILGGASALWWRYALPAARAVAAGLR